MKPGRIRSQVGAVSSSLFRRRSCRSDNRNETDSEGHPVSLLILADHFETSWSCARSSSARSELRWARGRPFIRGTPALRVDPHLAARRSRSRSFSVSASSRWWRAKAGPSVPRCPASCAATLRRRVPRPLRRRQFRQGVGRPVEIGKVDHRPEEWVVQLLTLLCGIERNQGDDQTSPLRGGYACPPRGD